MPALSFKKEFVDMVESGKKTQSIRLVGKRQFRFGDKVYLYTGMRTKQCRKLGEGIINEVPFSIGMHLNLDPPMLGCSRCDLHRIKNLAQRDGFKDDQEMLQWFQKQYGKKSMFFNVIRWELIKNDNK
ncbi:TPA_asm: hypothetical protein vir520_00028 [Caudoviricetes sp. vir520]|nr:TPA_asm: hypothetical protein vir520_00028 [Caudoviricetes sp. vir520]